MTTLSKDEIVRMAREAGFSDSNGVVHVHFQLEHFAHLCRADLVEETAALKAEVEGLRLKLEATTGRRATLRWQRDALKQDRDEWKEATELANVRFKKSESQVGALKAATEPAKLMEAALCASSRGFISGTTNWAAHMSQVLRNMKRGEA